jgi:hypothetical protein
VKSGIRYFQHVPDFAFCRNDAVSGFFRDNPYFICLEIECQIDNSPDSKSNPLMNRIFSSLQGRIAYARPDPPISGACAVSFFR